LSYNEPVQTREAALDRRKSGKVQGKLLWLVILAAAVAACLPSAASRRAETYRTGLEARAGQESKDVVPVVTTEWQFELLDAWEAENPGLEIVRTHDRREVGFSAQEVRDLFAAPGRYKVMTFIKKTGSSSPRTGEINEMGFPTKPDSSWEVRTFAVIRLVFRDGRLVHFRVWPTLDESRFSPGTMRKY
jgi:hypothetical protein